MVDSPLSDPADLNSRTVAVVLAAGAGSRFAASHHKLLADFRGKPVLAWAVEAPVTAGFVATVVVAGAVPAATLGTHLEAWLSTPSLCFVDNPRWDEGQSTSLQVGVAAARDLGAEAIVVGLGDQPLVGPVSWRAVAAASTPIAICSYDGRMQPPVLLHRSVWPLLPIAGDFGARHLIRLHPELVSPVVCTDNPIDIDTVEDLRRWN